MQGRCWATLDAQIRFPVVGLCAADISECPGVYAVYREGQAVYVGKADSLRQRLWHNHLGRGAVMTGSALRRNIAEHLGIASAGDIKARRFQPDARELSVIREWLETCEVGWMACASKEDALRTEDALKGEFKPMLTKR